MEKICFARAISTNCRSRHLNKYQMLDIKLPRFNSAHSEMITDYNSDIKIDRLKDFTEHRNTHK